MTEETIPRATVVEIAAQVRALRELQRQQAHTQAKMIRACVQALRQTTEQAQRRLERVKFRTAKNGHYRPATTAEAQHEVRKDREMALLHLDMLATMLEDANPSDNLTPSNEGK